jgi:hypothetical protein
MKFLTTVVVFLFTFAACSLAFLALGVPFRGFASLAGAVVVTWVVRAWVFAKVAEWKRNVDASHESGTGGG